MQGWTDEYHALVRSICLTPDRHAVRRTACRGFQAPQRMLTCVAMYVRSSSARRGLFSERSCRQRIARTLANTCSAVRAMKMPQITPGMPACTHSLKHINCGVV